MAERDAAQEKAQDYCKKAMDDLKTVIALKGESADLYRDAAMFYALVKPKDKDAIPLMCHYLEKAILLGEPHEGLLKHACFSSLANHPAFQRLHTLVPLHKKRVTATLVLDPLHGQLLPSV